MTKPTGKPRGRPKGSKNKRTIGRELSAYRMAENCERNRAGLRPVRLSQATVTPLDVMEDNMEWGHQSPLYDWGDITLLCDDLPLRRKHGQTAAEAREIIKQVGGTPTSTPKTTRARTVAGARCFPRRFAATRLGGDGFKGLLSAEKRTLFNVTNDDSGRSAQRSS
jgi:hypothetical protein